MAKADLNQIMEVPYTTNLECPACGVKLQVVVDVEIESGEVNYVGSGGFHDPHFSVGLKTTIKKFKIHHECEFKEKKR